MAHKRPATALTVRAHDQLFGADMNKITHTTVVALAIVLLAGCGNGVSKAPAETHQLRLEQASIVELPPMPPATPSLIATDFTQ